MLGTKDINAHTDLGYGNVSRHTDLMSRSWRLGIFSHLRRKCFLTLASAWNMARGIALSREEQKHGEKLFREIRAILNASDGRTSRRDSASISLFLTSR